MLQCILTRLEQPQSIAGSIAGSIASIAGASQPGDVKSVGVSRRGAVRTGGGPDLGNRARSRTAHAHGQGWRTVALAGAAARRFSQPPERTSSMRSSRRSNVSRGARSSKRAGSRGSCSACGRAFTEASERYECRQRYGSRPEPEKLLSPIEWHELLESIVGASVYSSQKENGATPRHHQDTMTLGVIVTLYSASASAG